MQLHELEWSDPSVHYAFAELGGGKYIARAKTEACHYNDVRVGIGQYVIWSDHDDQHWNCLDALTAQSILHHLFPPKD